MNAPLLSLALAISLTAGGPAPSLSASPNGSTGSGIELVPTVPIVPVVPLQEGCAADPHACGFPDATHTGVPAGTTLKKVPGQISSGPGWYYDPRGWVEVDGNGAVLTDLFIPCNLDISASHVTVRDVEVEASGQSSFGISLRHTSDVTIEDSTIEGDNTGNGRLMVGIKDIFGDATRTSVLDNNIMRAATGVQIYQGLIQGNFIHDMGYIDGDHINGVTVSGGITPLTIQDNTIFVDNGQTDAISLFQDTQVEASKVIKDNLLAGGGYAIYGGEGAQPASNIVIADNRISSIFFPNGGLWGPVAYFSTGHGNVWTGNVWDSTGIAIPAP